MRKSLLIALGALVATVACRPTDQPPPQLQPHYDRATGKLRELAYDSDADGHLDMKATMDGSRVLKVVVDENRDGRPDRWEYFEPSSSSDASPTPTRIERAMRRDGRVTRTEGFEQGKLTWAEEDRDGDGRTDRWETYVDGALSTLALDTVGRGTPNRRMTYVGDTVEIEDK